MGNFWQRLYSGFHNRDVRVLMVGLDAAGKTTALYMLKLGQIVTTIPTIGFNVETVEHNGTKFVTWDISGRDGIRPLWKHYYQNTEVIILVLDSNDRDRISECKDELWRLLGEEELVDATILVLANKQDLPSAMSVEEVAERLEIEKVKNRNIKVQGTCATTGEGLREGLTWIQETLAEQKLERSTIKSNEESKEKPKPHTTWWSTINRYFVKSPA